MFKTIHINANERVLVFKKGKFTKYLKAGKHYLFNSDAFFRYNVTGEFKTIVPVEMLLENEELKSELDIYKVADNELGFLYRDGNFSQVLSPGEYAFFNVLYKNSIVKFDISSTEVPENFPRYLFDKIDSKYYKKATVEPWQIARLYIDKKFVRMLNSGIYYFWNNGIDVKVDNMETRLTNIDMNGQEILTLDKIALRLNFSCEYKIVDFENFGIKIVNVKDNIYSAMQIALREYVGRYSLDELLENRDKIGDYAFERLKERESDFCVEFKSAAIKDIILPGDVKDILNTVVLAQKRAQANVITRREETASTRSLLNTARLIDENQTLAKLKELEYIKEIFANVSRIELNANSDLISQLTKIITNKPQNG